MISIKQLTYALAVSKTMHFRKAADLCHVSQSSLSTGLNELERQLGIKIFERDNKKVLLTKHGGEVVEKARSILSQVDELVHIAESHSQPFSFPMSIGIIPTIAPYLLPRLMSALQHHHPNASLTFIEEESHHLVEKVQRGEIDTAILALPYPCHGLLSLEFWQEDFVWVASKGGDYTELPNVTTEQLSRANLMLLAEGHCLKDQILNLCNIPEQDTLQSYRATSLNTLVQMVISGLGSTLIPQMAVEQLVTQHCDLSVVPLNEPGPHRRIA
ncbi:hydrogen peroxide-inducible genes activator [Vibrio variabilis]|uniref:hydrogen peroxide-inducible genes activator n=1 Tax=Vibrio variabilis TaxID=990271 RepID=UPI001EFA1C9B|nr:hydrogen peroxide-inducible genes activator [Vibrio variabilis]